MQDKASLQDLAHIKLYGVIGTMSMEVRETELQAKPGFAGETGFAGQIGLQAKPGLAGQTGVAVRTRLQAKPGFAGQTGCAGTRNQVDRVFVFWGL